MQHFVIEKWGLVYFNIDKNKVISECRLNEILLDDN